MNFTLILFILVIVTGVAWVTEKLLLQPKRFRAARAALVDFDQQQISTAVSGTDSVPLPDEVMQARDKVQNDLLREPWWIEYSASFFPVIFMVFILRSFVVEPFKIPSSSMGPTLLPGDFILVNKYQYGIRLPVINKKIFDIGDPKRGDVMVFRYSKDESIDYIKRVVGLPGDVIAYQSKHLTINGKSVPEIPVSDYFDTEHIAYFKQYEEEIGAVKHRILKDPNMPSYILNTEDFPFRENCTYNKEGVICNVPLGYYFMMGDNRDNSADSRYWGFVPDKNIVGRAFFIWMNFLDLKRLGVLH
ncbi:signal peptidase I [Candidatus Pandoraea novymonadis]|uniref:Signal peptidase I n=1 Tax=Candidatus Pandoraea novymonadis TaxID=1808959 RepID=A0ABX5FCY2_9BURK|nr:signal peptidase I [Candidatus Pandoraea novymonadis]PSB91643.1 Signal peptidase I [Candidatus Pandoraea novymonadis]